MKNRLDRLTVLLLMMMGLAMPLAPRAIAQDTAEAVPDAPAEAVEIEEEEEDEDPFAEQRAEEERLSVEASLSQARLDAELRALNEEVTRLQAKASLEDARHRAEMAAQERRHAEIDAKLADEAKKLEAELAEAHRTVERLQAAQSLADAQQQAKFAAARAEVAEIEQAMALAAARQQKALGAMQLANEKLEAELNTLRTKASRAAVEFELKMAEHQRSMAALEADIARRDLKARWASAVNDDLDYAANPFKDGVLRISDRRIDLNGPIYYGTDDHVCDRIHFFNNQSKTKPIFIVIDRSPGGSVMTGYRILKAMEASEAPIHVVVKSYAASMAACIATLADHSYAYPNAIILHHQMSAGLGGNMTQMEEQYERMKEWAKRLHNPIAEKMGVTPKKFTEMMYEANSDGDWEEFATDAVKLKWVDHVVREVREEGLREKPQQDSWGWFFFFQKELAKFEKTDADGKKYFELPRLEPLDMYYMYNPDNYYRLR